MRPLQVNMAHPVTMRSLATPTALEATIAEADPSRKFQISLVPFWEMSNVLVLVANGNQAVVKSVVSQGALCAQPFMPVDKRKTIAL